MNKQTGTFPNICLRCISAVYVVLAVVSAVTLVWVFMIR